MTKVGFISLGCSKNQVDTEVMLKSLADAGYTIVSDETEADIVVINTCGFIESAKRESIDNILDVAWLKENRSLRGIVVTGCMAERYREQIFSEMPEVDALLGVGSLAHIVDAVRAVDSGEKYRSFEDKEKSPLGGERILTTPAYSAYLKIAEGCDNRCTYCAIPLIRGRLRSRPIEDLVAEAVALGKNGAKELNIIAQDTSRYGLDLYGRYRLTDLVREICRATDIPWIRLLYCYPDKITDELIAEMRDNPRLLPYMDRLLEQTTLWHEYSSKDDGSEGITILVQEFYKNGTPRKQPTQLLSLSYEPIKYQYVYGKWNDEQEAFEAGTYKAVGKRSLPYLVNSTNYGTLDTAWPAFLQKLEDVVANKTSINN